MSNEKGLSEFERQALAQNENTIQQHLDTFWKVAAALIDIRDRRLYREQYASFSRYCKERWQFTERYARYVMSGKRLFDDLVQMGVAVLPETEAQIRPLTSFDAATAVGLWDSTVRKALDEGDDVTRARVQAETDRYFVEQSPYTYLVEKIDSRELKAAVAKKVMIALDSVEAQVRGLMVKANITDTSLIFEMNRLFQAESEVYEIILTTGYLQFDSGQGVKLENCTLLDLRRMIDEHRTHRIREESIANGALYVPLYKRNPAKSLKNIQSYMGDEDFENFVMYVQNREKEVQHG